MSISLNSVRISISQYWDGSIEKDLLVEIRDRVEKYQETIIKECIKEFQDYNKIRSFHHLSLLKRLSQPKLYKQIDYIEDGENGKEPIETHSSQSRRGNLYEK